MDKAHELVRLNFEDLVKARYPGGVYDDGGPPMEVKRRAKCIECVFCCCLPRGWLFPRLYSFRVMFRRRELVEYRRMRDDEARLETHRTFLLSRMTGVAQWKEPEWESKWKERRDRRCDTPPCRCAPAILTLQWVARCRSERLGRLDDEWQLFFDPELRTEFKYNASTGEHEWRRDVRGRK